VKQSLMIVSPLPPAWSGIATYTAQLLPHLAADWDVTVMVGDDEVVDVTRFPGVEVIHASSWGWRRAIGEFDRILFCLGNSPAHRHVPALVARHGGVVLAHDARLNALQTVLSIEDADRHRLSRLVEAHHGPQLAVEIRALEDIVDPRERFAALHQRLDRANTSLLAPSAEGASSIVVHSEFAARLARLDVSQRVPVSVVPFGHPALREPRGASGPSPARTIMSTFGFVAPEKDAVLLVDSLASANAMFGTDLELRFVGHCDPAYRTLLTARADAGGVGDRVVFVGRADDRTYGTELDDAVIAVQLRASANGEASAAIADCLSAGIPTVVTAIGGQRELPDHAVRKVPVGASPELLGGVIAELAADAAMRRDLSEGARMFARNASFASAAEALGTALRNSHPPRR
jgi:glycosyltransferase involved in cell wall biosynthesis